MLNAGGSGGGIFVRVSEDPQQAIPCSAVDFFPFNHSVAITLTNSTVTNNVADGDVYACGGGVFVSAGAVLTISNSTITGNRAGQFGGGLAVGSGTGALRIISGSVLSGNSAKGGAQLYMDGSADVFVSDSTIEMSVDDSQVGPAWHGTVARDTQL